MYHYQECGLEDIWLSNGYSIEDSPYGQAVIIDNLEGLHEALAHLIVNEVPNLSGTEFRFLREFLNLSQKKIGGMFGCEDQTVALWEKEDRVPKMAADYIRFLVTDQIRGSVHVTSLLEKINEIDVAEARVKRCLREGATGWQKESEACA